MVLATLEVLFLWRLLANMINTIRDNLIYIISICLGILISMVGAYFIQSAYRSWQDYYTQDGYMIGTWAIMPVTGAVMVFFVATLLFIGDEFYKNVSIRRIAFLVGIILIAGGVTGVIFAAGLFYYAITWDSVMAAYGIIGILGTCLAFGTATILFKRVRRAE